MTATAQRLHTDVGGFRIHSVHQGSGPPVVLLHGLSGSYRWWRYTAPALAEQHRVHTVDLVGFGGSRAARQPGIGEMAEILSRWLEALGITTPHLVGHSMGGQIALHMLAEQDVQVRSLTLVDASGMPRQRHVVDAARLLGSAFRPRTWGTPWFVPSIAADAVRAGPRNLLRAGLHLLADDVRPLLPRIHCPTLIVWGALDPLLPLEHGRALAAGIPDARLVVIDDAAHNPMVDRPMAFNRLLLEHFASA